MQDVRDYLVITLGLALYAVGFTCFQLPYELATGGLSGIAAVIFYGTGFPVQYTFFLVNIVLLIIAVKVLGWRFCVKTVFAVFVLTLLLGLAQDFMRNLAANNPDMFQSVNPKSKLPHVVYNNPFMSCLLAAVLEGIGIGMVFVSNGSTGGTDIINAIINKYKDVTLGQMNIVIDFMIVTSSLLLPTSSIEKLLYGYCTLVITGILLDYVVEKGRQSVQFLIFSRRYDEIAAAINRTHRGVTVLDAQGWYTKEERKVLVVMAKQSESTTIFRIIQNVDPNAFVSQSKVIGVYGEGFDKIKVKADKKEKAIKAE